MVAVKESPSLSFPYLPSLLLGTWISRCNQYVFRMISHYYLGLLTEGIFRLSGAAPEVEQLQQDFDKPPTYGRYLDLSQSDIHAITGTVKKFLRQLPDPAIPTISHEKFIQLFGK